MESKVVKAYLLNTPVAGDAVTASGVTTVTGWFPVKTNQIVNAIKVSSAAEVRQIVTVVASSAILASTKYQVQIDA